MCDGSTISGFHAKSWAGVSSNWYGYCYCGLSVIKDPKRWDIFLLTKKGPPKLLQSSAGSGPVQVRASGQSVPGDKLSDAASHKLSVQESVKHHQKGMSGHQWVGFRSSLSGITYCGAKASSVWTMIPSSGSTISGKLRWYLLTWVSVAEWMTDD